MEVRYPTQQIIIRDPNELDILELQHFSQPLIIRATKDGHVDARLSKSQRVVWKTPHAHKAAIRALEWPSTHACFATGGEDGWVRVWETKSGTLLAAKCFAGSVNVLAWSGNEREIAIAGPGQLLCYWIWQQDQTNPDPAA